MSLIFAPMTTPFLLVDMSLIFAPISTPFLLCSAWPSPDGQRADILDGKPWLTDPNTLVNGQIAHKFFRGLVQLVCIWLAI